MTLSVYTQNTFGIPLYGTGGRLKKIAQKIFETQPDVVFLQEIQWKGHVPIFMHEKYDLFHAPGIYATAGGLLTLVKKEFGGESNFVKFRSQGGVKQIADRMTGKGLLDVYIKKHDLHVINTHFMSTYTKGFVEDLRQLRQIEEFIEYTRPLKKFIGAGDLNFPSESPYHKKFIEEIIDFTLGMEHSHMYVKSKIDFIFGKGKIGVKKKKYVAYDKFVSDHRGIWLEAQI